MKTPRNQPLRWSIEWASKEFGIDRRTLTKTLTAAGISAGSDGKWATREILVAIYGDKDAAELRLTLAKAAQIERKNRVADGQLVETEAVCRFAEGLGAALRERVMALPIEHASKESMLAELQKLDAGRVKDECVNPEEESGEEEAES